MPQYVHQMVDNRAGVPMYPTAATFAADAPEVPRVSLTDELREAITSGWYVPNQRLVETDLCEE